MIAAACVLCWQFSVVYVDVPIFRFRCWYAMLMSLSDIYCIAFYPKYETQKSRESRGWTWNAEKWYRYISTKLWHCWKYMKIWPNFKTNVHKVAWEASSAVEFFEVPKICGSWQHSGVVPPNVWFAERKPMRLFWISGSQRLSHKWWYPSRNKVFFLCDCMIDMAMSTISWWDLLFFCVVTSTWGSIIMVW